MTNIESFLLKLNDNLNLLREREAKHGGEAPLALVNQIRDHETAIALTEKAVAGEIGETEWQAALQPLLLGNDHWAGVSLSAMLALSRYAPDNGDELSRQVGSQVTALAAEIFDLVLEKVKAIDARTAQRYPQNPTGYDAPLSDALAELLEANQTLTSQLKTLLTQYEAAVKTHQATGPQATITGSGVITQQSTLTAGDRGVVGSSAGDNIITGSGNIIGDVSVSDSTGVGIGAESQVSVTQGMSGQDLNQLLTTIYQQIEAKTDLSPQDKADLKAEVDDLQSEVSEKTDPAEVSESFLARRLRNIERMAPDIIDTIATTAVNPVAGLKGVWDKIVAKAREIKAARQAS